MFSGLFPVMRKTRHLPKHTGKGILHAILPKSEGASKEKDHQNLRRLQPFNDDSDTLVAPFLHDLHNKYFSWVYEMIPIARMQWMEIITATEIKHMPVASKK